MRVQEIMTAEVKTISPDATAVEANECMWRHQIRYLVVQQDSSVVGILSDSDLGGTDAETIPDGLIVAKCMTPDPVTVAPDATIDDALNRMNEHGIHCLPVMALDQLVGIVTAGDIERLSKRGRTQPPFGGDERQDPNVPLHRRTRGKSKHSHTEWP